MTTPLRIVLWNANGLSNHKLELQTFLDMNKIDIALISETHFTSRTVFLKSHTTLYTTPYTLTILHMEVQQSYSVTQYVITNYHTISLTKYRLQPYSLTLTHGP